MTRLVTPLAKRPLGFPQGLVAFAVVAAVGVVLPAPVWAQSVETRVERLERDIETLSRSVFKGENPKGVLATAANAANAQTAQYEQLTTRVDQLEQDLRELTNRAEEQGNLLNQINRAIEDLAVRMRAAEQAGALQAPAAGAVSPATPILTPPVVSSPRGPNDPAATTSSTVEPLGAITNNAATGQAVVPAGDPTFLYENALELLKQRDYTLAEKSLNDFLKTYPNHQLTANAKYWLGETYFVQDRFAESARVFAEGYQKYPKGPKAADNLLKLGLSLAAQNNTNDACVALKQIAKDFPTGAGAVKSRADSEIKKLKCS